ncbi:hypothetical protein BGZ92_005832 [Podila epicladia]|nr:hypothetical protein BGZ92_005832 [Podila epicladia]
MEATPNWYHIFHHHNDSFDITATYTTEDDDWSISRSWASRIAVLDRVQMKALQFLLSQELTAFHYHQQKHTGPWEFDSPKPWTRVAIDTNPQVLKACFSGVLSFGDYDWAILIPEVQSVQRTMVANCLVDALPSTCILEALHAVS